jgi:hypothetical protein
MFNKSDNFHIFNGVCCVSAVNNFRFKQGAIKQGIIKQETIVALLKCRGEER